MTAQPTEPAEPIDWAAIAEALANDLTETPKLEGSMPMPPEIRKLRTRRLSIDKRMEALKFEKDQIRDQLRAALISHNVKAFTIFGKNKVSISQYPKTYPNVDAIKELYPSVAGDPRCWYTNDEERVNVNK